MCIRDRRDRAKADFAAKRQGHGDQHAYREIADTLGRAVEFTGYAEVVSEARVAGLVVGGEGAQVAREGDEIEPVSYTHLDVYKRQASIGALTHRQRSKLGVIPAKAGTNPEISQHPRWTERPQDGPGASPG